MNFCPVTPLLTAIVWISNQKYFEASKSTHRELVIVPIKWVNPIRNNVTKRAQVFLSLCIGVLPSILPVTISVFAGGSDEASDDTTVCCDVVVSVKFVVVVESVPAQTHRRRQRH